MPAPALPTHPKQRIAARCAQELRAGEVVNLGLGIPTLTANYLDADAGVIFHTENGAFGFGGRPSLDALDSDVTNAGCEPITLPPGAALMDLATSLGAMRNGYIDVTILGALQVDAQGNLANWACRRDGKWWPGIGGAMDLCHGTRKVIAALQHTDKHGRPKILPRCTLPLTGSGCVKVIVTEHAVFDVTDDGLVLREILSHATLEDIRAMTGAPFTLAPTRHAQAAPATPEGLAR
ncbi:succinyl-CoA--3-ketoacid-CoA transferase [Burkholderia ubonensis]|uniref:Succinyl-CoA--3-ketoacid-CoA transferase n=1 Tax=Burkholderia ubonensis TaxID=101571 RepID=A0A119SZ76_9BURK|nr:3-oxoacid CoA-transferase subunit B [Burkholderia ubonensis]AOJ67295.1 succinyl-CoA--3-ketoacid-CoA transferase [Burkholderia ubonensis]KVG60284.1 succinyl-CoA--3-ketoacid-CoA transferase [Burkholderia ubonensis]KWI72976.1 succinyl-CoA--3-ketoacid-CoA transferase [Burkholderia ubonensis]